MKSTAITLLLLLVALDTHQQLFAQSVNAPPYLYYYSQLLGGLIIERADGTESRHIAADVIPPDLSGLSGPGWSPSGRYFASAGLNFGDYNASSSGTFLIDAAGKEVVNRLTRISTQNMQWSPDGSDWLLIIGNIGGISNQQTAFWLIDAQERKVAAEYAGIFSLQPYETTPIIWETLKKQVRFYVEPKAFSQGEYFQVTMKFDGTVLKESATKADFESYFIDPVSLFQDNEEEQRYTARGTSPSRRFEASGLSPNLLRDRVTNTTVELPIHTQMTTCRAYEWSTDEAYLITLNGTLRAGGGCYLAVLGVTDHLGNLRRELGTCSWGAPCVGWLPPQIDTASLPAGQPRPIQLDPVAYEKAESAIYVWEEKNPVFLRCEGDMFRIFSDQTTSEILYQLHQDETCPYHSPDLSGININIAYDAQHQLLATYFGDESPVLIWSTENNPAVQILKLNTYGYELEFTDDGKYLRARNVNSWKIYAVEDILAASIMLQ